ncbi:MAG: RNA-binding cell elongation regulator Jag/EloR [Acidimicrobiales bacterium]
MEWVETTGSTDEAAKDAALDQLGVDEQDAEFEILEEAKSGLFGLTRREARVRARVRPTSPRPKVERRDRRRPKSDGAKRGEGRSAKAPKKASTKPAKDDTTTESEPSRAAADAEATAPSVDNARPAASESTDERPARRSRGARRPATSKAASTATNDTNQEGSPMSSDDATVEQQADIIADFVEGLVEAYGLDGEVSQTTIDDETIEVQIEGDDLGLLIGPKGQTLTAIQELSRTVVQRRASGTHHGRVRLDVSGYRQRRREALERFARSVADDVRESGVQKALEPMNAADRKVVHDTVNEIDGVSTVSEGEDQRRRVVILPVD